MSPQIYLKGPRRTINEALTDYISRNLGLVCQSIQALYEIAKVDLLKNRKPLLLIDCSGLPETGLWSLVEETLTAPNNDYDVAFINVDVRFNGEIKDQVYRRGLAGFFPEDTPLELLLKGIQKIMAGELWFSRETMSRLLKNGKNNLIDTSAKEIFLTKREKEVLDLIASGCTNTEIADRLYISPHTVKTHLQNLYKKIGVCSRLQAALFGAAAFSKTIRSPR